MLAAAQISVLARDEGKNLVAKIPSEKSTMWSDVRQSSASTDVCASALLNLSLIEIALVVYLSLYVSRAS